MDLSEHADEELDVLRKAVLSEIERRQTIHNAVTEAEDISRRYLEAVGRTDGTEWVQPTGAHDAYPEYAIVLHDDKEWESLIPANVWEPGVSGWRPKPEGDGPAEWQKPTGAHDAYKAGDLVLFEDKTYESLINGNTWSPSEHPTGWREVE